MKYYRIGSEKITIGYPGYDRKKFKVQSSKFKVEEVKRKYNVKSDYILFLSTLKPSKNIEGLLGAFKRITSHVSRIALVIAGKKGWMFEEIFKKVKQLGLEQKVVFTDFVEEEDVPLLMAGAKVFVMPSFWEGFGIPVVEAMACGTPVVVSKTGSLPEIVGQAGVLIDPYNSEDIALGIKKAMKEKNKLAARGLEQSCQFNWLNCAEKVIKVLEKVGGLA